jgi:hypothetical protein
MDMADETKQAWNKVGERFGSVGKRLADRYREGGSDAAAAAEAEGKLEEVAKELMDRVGRAVDAVDGTVRDSEARNDFKDALNALGDALTATAKDVESAVRRNPSPGDEPPSSGNVPPGPSDEPPSSGNETPGPDAT